MPAPKKASKNKPAKKVVAKKVAKKSAPKKAVAKSVSKKQTQTTKRTVPEEKQETIVKETEIVTIPTDAGVRLEKKAEAKRALAFELLKDPMYKIAYVSSFCFMLVGLSTIVSHYISIDSDDFLATTCLSGTDCVISTTDISSPTNSVSGGTAINTADPIFKMLDSIPTVLSEETKLNFSVTNGINVAANLLSIDSGGLYPLELKQLSNQNYRITINSTSLPPGDYSLKIFVTKVDGTGTFSYPGGRLNIPQTQKDISTTKDAVESNATSSDTTTEVRDETENLDSESVSTDEDIDFVQIKPIDIESSFEIVLTNKIFSNREAVRVIAPDDYKKIDLYVRAEKAINARYLGSMSKEYDRWIYAFDSNNLPNGTYELFASATIEGDVKTTPSQMITVENTTVVINPERITQPTDVEDVSVPNRNFYLYQGSSTAVSVKQDAPFAVSETEKLMNKNSEQVNDLLQRYAIAVQSGNEVVIEAINQEIEDEKERLTTDVVLNPLTSTFSAQISQEIDVTFTDLKNRVDTFEKIRSSRDSLVLDDSDNDGISDHDEVTVFNTDPNNPDSDNDGFIDGAEVIGGFDPNNSEPEVTIKYELPQQVIGLERADILKIETIRPIIDMDDASNVTSVKAEISGKGIPNSFATIYVFSTPVIVTVKTDAEGSFTYQFDKELEDGTHEVFVAFTDNSGSILAHSEPFQFVKEAQAFSPIDASDEQIVSAAPITETTANEAYRLVLGLAVLVLGFILLMLGINIRSEKQAQVEKLA